MFTINYWTNLLASLFLVFCIYLLSIEQIIEFYGTLVIFFLDNILWLLICTCMFLVFFTKFGYFWPWHEKGVKFTCLIIYSIAGSLPMEWSVSQMCNFKLLTLPVSASGLAYVLCEFHIYYSLVLTRACMDGLLYM